MKQIENHWPDFLSDFDFSLPGGFHAFPEPAEPVAVQHNYGRKPVQAPFWERLQFRLLELSHVLFFNTDASLAPLYQRLSKWFDGTHSAGAILHFAENVGKQVMLDCQQCGDCAIQHLAFQCPESGCPKHIRNGRCEVYSDRWCIWYQTYLRWAYAGKSNEMVRGCIPPRKWELGSGYVWLQVHKLHSPAQVGAGPHLVLVEFPSGKGSSGRIGGVCALLQLTLFLRPPGKRHLYRNEVKERSFLFCFAMFFDMLPTMNRTKVQ